VTEFRAMVALDAIFDQASDTSALSSTKVINVVVNMRIIISGFKHRESITASKICQAILAGSEIQEFGIRNGNYCSFYKFLTSGC
jgi:hypothetical protein